MHIRLAILFFFFFNDTATTEIYTLSLHDALPISRSTSCSWRRARRRSGRPTFPRSCAGRSEEHTSELQSRLHLVCRLLLEKKKENTQLAVRHHEYYRDVETQLYVLPAHR